MIIKNIAIKLLVFLSMVSILVVTMGLLTEKALALDEYECLSCHSDPDLTKETADGKKVSLFVDKDNINISAHRFIDCTTCHTTKPHAVETSLNKLSLAEKCGSCHKYEYEVHLKSVHGQQLLKGNPDVATCVDCHSPTNNPHSVIRVLEYSAPSYKKNISQTCAKCHGNEELMKNYGIVEKVYESYMRSFHGKAMQLGTYEITQLDKATCTNCHGVHDIKSTDNPDSPVAGLDNLAKTCEQCHIGAGQEFASGFLGHKEASPQNVPVAYFTERFFTIFLTIVITFGILLVIAAIIRFSINKWKE